MNLESGRRKSERLKSNKKERRTAGKTNLIRFNRYKRKIRNTNLSLINLKPRKASLITHRVMD